MIHLCITQCTYWTPLLSVKLPIVLLRFIQRNSKALNCDASKLLRLKYNYTRPVPGGSPQRQDQVSADVYILSHKLCIYYCVNVCFHAGLPRSLYIQCDCMFPCWTPTELVYPLVLMLDSHRACIMYILLLCECVFPCWTPTELVYPV